MRRLGVRLAVAFAAVILVSVGGVALLAGRETANEFRTYVERGRGVFSDRMANTLSRYYVAHGDWAGVDWVLQAWLRGPFDRLAVADAQGVIVADTDGRGIGEPADAALGPGVPVVVGGETVGRAYAYGVIAATGRAFRLGDPLPTPVAGETGPFARGARGDGESSAAARTGRADGESGGPPRTGRADGESGGPPRTGRVEGEPRRPREVVPPPAPPPRPATSIMGPATEAAFIEQVNRAFVLSALAAAALAGLLSLLFARQLAGPLRELAEGARRIASGDFARRVPVRAPDEVGALAVAFNEMADSLERAEIARRNLVADVAHELRTPLAVVEGTVDAMLDGVYPADRTRLESIREEVALLTKLVADLRELSLAEAGGLRLETASLEPAALVRRTVAAAGARAEARGLRLVAAAGDDLPLIEADGGRVAQVLANLLDNALRYTPAGGQIVVGACPAPAGARPPLLAPPVDVAPVGDADREVAAAVAPLGGAERTAMRTNGAASLIATAARPATAVQVTPPTPGVDRQAGMTPLSPSPESPAGVCFWVADSGPGIAADDLPLVFERFYRADPSRARRSGGSGLGLAIARRYVEAHGGTIWADSAPGQGATIAFWLPLVPTARPEPTRTIV